MNRTEIIELLAERHELSKAEAGRVLATLLDSVVATVKKGGTVSLPGFGSFKQSSRAARTGRNPSTGEAVKIAATKVPRFTAGTGFKDAVDPKAATRRAAKKAAVPAKKAAPAKKVAAPAKKAAAAPAKKAAVAPAKKAAAPAKKKSK
jgi:DNA-binding protein HU-beta